MIWARWLGLGAIVGLSSGVSAAAFLLLLDVATNFRTGHELLVFALPLAGLAIGFAYDRFGASAKGGTNLVLDALHQDTPPIPARMAVMVLLGTVVTHLFGGSAGREGTAVQMGASLADQLTRRFPSMRRELVSAGIAGGFGAVFGTPIAGAVFALEVGTLGKLEVRALIPAAVAAFVGDLTTRQLGITHTAFPSVASMDLSLRLLGIWLIYGLAIGLTAMAFIESTKLLKRIGQRWAMPLRLFLAGTVVVALWRLADTSDYLGLGVPTIVSAFSNPDLPASTFAWKFVFTAVTVGLGFIGGEVTPLFFIGAALGSVLARALGLPLELGAGVGLAAMFAAASNTPLALSIMAAELFGISVLPHVLFVSAIAYFVVGHRSIYGAQRMTRTKYGRALDRPVRLADW